MSQCSYKKENTIREAAEHSPFLSVHPLSTVTLLVHSPLCDAHRSGRRGSGNHEGSGAHKYGMAREYCLAIRCQKAGQLFVTVARRGPTAFGVRLAIYQSSYQLHRSAADRCLARRAHSIQRERNDGCRIKGYHYGSPGITRVPMQSCIEDRAMIRFEPRSAGAITARIRRSASRVIRSSRSRGPFCIAYRFTLLSNSSARN